MASYEEARRLVLEHVAPLECEPVALVELAGRVSAEAVTAPWPMPLSDNSAMDGFAVRSVECEHGIEIPVRLTIYAGQSGDVSLPPRTAARIMTGAPVPAGADAVVPFEDCEDRGHSVLLRKQVDTGAHIRFRGEDVKQGAVVIASGTVLHPAQVSIAAACGKDRVAVYRRPRVAIISTGDELVPPGKGPESGQTVDSNSYGLAAAVAEAGGIPVVLGIARDNEGSHADLLSHGLQCDAVITSAGVSAGYRDLVRDVLAKLGMTTVFSGVDIRPGGPTTFGTVVRTPVFCLPGNPVASLITFEQFVRPALLRMAGHTQVERTTIQAILQETAKKKSGKVKFLRVRVALRDGHYVASSAGDQNTGMLSTLVASNGLAILDSAGSLFPAGSTVRVQLLADVVEH